MTCAIIVKKTEKKQKYVHDLEENRNFNKTYQCKLLLVSVFDLISFRVYSHSYSLVHVVNNLIDYCDWIFQYQVFDFIFDLKRFNFNTSLNSFSR